MSCQVRSKASISELNRVKRLLFPDEDIEDDDRWNDVDAWSWKADFEDTTEQSSKITTDWLQTCLVSMSPQAQILVIANMDRYVVLVAKWEKSNDQEVQKYQLISPPTATHGLADEITAVLCVPIKSLQKSSQGMPDWVCIVLGFNSGAVHMYTTEGNLLMSQTFHDEPVQQLKFDSHSSDSARELCILYSKIAVTVDVLGFFNALRACRSYLAKGRAFQGSNADVTFNPPPLHYKKYSLQDQQKTNDCHALGTIAPNQFDHLVTASIAGGFHARYSNAPPVSTGILSLGSQPYCAWHYAVEGSATPLLTDVAYALASKVTSKIFSKASGWLGWGSSKTESGPSAKNGKENRTEPATPVYPKFGLADSLREALSVVLSPNEKLAAVTDSLGRITLIDIYKGIAVRVWKGYREAQCGWVASWEDVDASAARADDEQSATARTASFLVIYIAKRGLLEVWTAQQGTRVAAFNCSKNAKLLYVGISSCDRELSQCRLLSPDGTIADVVVPFHCALKGDSSQKARDLHILQQLRTELNRGDSAPNLELLMEIRHAGVVSQGLDLLLGCQVLNAEAFAGFLSSLVEHYVQAEALDAESRLLLSRSRLLSQLLNVYVHLKTVRSRPPDYDTATNAASMTDREVAGALYVTIDDLLRVVSKRQTHAMQPPSVVLSGVTDPAMHEFLQAFELSCGHSNVDCIRLKSSLSPSDHVRLSRWIFSSSFGRPVDELDELTSVLKNSLIVPEDLAFLLITYWLSLEAAPPLAALAHFHKLLAYLCNLAGLEDVVISDRPSSWWQKIGEVLSKSANLEQASSAALVCKAVTIQFEKKRLFKIPEKKCGDDDAEPVKMDDSMSDWEDMSVDMVQWNVLLKQLEDLSALSRLIRYQPSQLRRLNVSQLDYYLDQIPEDPLDFNLAGILQKGRGSVTELIARWLTQNLLEADVLFPGSSSVDDLSQDDSMSEAPTEWAPEADKISLGSSEEIAVIQELFQDVKQHLPHSTERDVVLLNVSLEYAAMWIKSPKLMPLLDRSLSTVLSLRSNLLRHGMCRMLWSMSLCPIFHDLALLMDKTGRLPKTFTSRKINLPSPDLAIPFLQATIKLLDTAITSAMSCELEAPPFLRYDDIWATCEGATPILEVAVRQRLINIDLVLLHLQLAQAMLFMANLEIKGIHPLSLFDQHAARLAFFQDLHTHPPLPSQFIEPTVASTRLLFLKQVIAKAVELMEQDQNVTLDYVNQAVKLGYEWSCDVDELRIKYVHLLYLNGRDHLASEVLPSIGSNEKLTPILLSVVGTRVKHLLQASDAASLSPMTHTWLNSLNQDGHPPVDLSPQDTVNLLIETLSRISTESSDQFIANELLSMMRSMLEFSQ